MGVGARSPGAGVGAGHRGGAPPLPVSLRRPPSPFLPALAAHTQNHTTKTTSSGIAPGGPRSGACGRQENAPGPLGARGWERPNLLAAAAGEVARRRRALRSGIAPWKAAPAAPPPARPPTAGGSGAGLRPCPCGGAASATPAGCAGRGDPTGSGGDRALLLPPLSCKRGRRCSRELGRRSPWTCGPRGGGRREAPLVSRAPARASWLRRCRRLRLVGAAVGAPEVATDHPGREEPRGPRAWASPRGEP